jgi:hypothetical protein
MNKNHETVWEAVNSELAKNPSAFSKEQIDEARSYARADSETRWRNHDFALVRNPICSAIHYSELDPIDRHKTGFKYNDESTPEMRLHKAVNNAASTRRIF